MLTSLFFTALSLFSLCAAGSPYDLVPPLSLDAHLNYDFMGSTMMSRNYVKLTADFPDQKGYIVSNVPGLLPDNFELTMEFHVGGGGRNMYGDGMVLWLLQDEPTPGSMFGLNEYYKGAAIAIDTYRNGNGGRVFPRLVLMKNDGTTPYDKDNDGNLNEIGGCALRGIHDNHRQDFSSLRVSYSKTLGTISVEVNFRNAWEVCATTQADLGPISRIAVSAATGELVERHVVQKLEFIDLGDQVPSIIDQKTQERNQRAERLQEKKIPEYLDDKKSGSSFLEFIGTCFQLLFKLVALAILVFIAFKAYKYFKKYQQQKEDNKYKLI